MENEQLGGSEECIWGNFVLPKRFLTRNYKIKFWRKFSLMKRQVDSSIFSFLALTFKIMQNMKSVEVSNKRGK